MAWVTDVDLLILITQRTTEKFPFAQLVQILFFLSTTWAPASNLQVMQNTSVVTLPAVLLVYMCFASKSFHDLTVQITSYHSKHDRECITSSRGQSKADGNPSAAFAQARNKNKKDVSKHAHYCKGCKIYLKAFSRCCSILPSICPVPAFVQLKLLVTKDVTGGSWQ